MSRRTSVTDRVGGHVVCGSEADRYSSRKTLFTAVESTVAALTAPRNLSAPGWSRSWTLRRSFGWGNVFSPVSDSDPDSDSDSDAGAGSDPAVSLDRSGSGTGTGDGAEAAGPASVLCAGAGRATASPAETLGCSLSVIVSDKAVWVK